MILKDITYNIKNKTILSDINTKFTNEGINLIIGPNGSGKSTLLKVIYGINKPTQGKVILPFEKKIAYMSQYNDLFHEVDLLYFLKLNRYLKTGVLKSDDYTEKIIEIFGLKDFLNRSLSTLSGGERQRGILASVFLLERDYYLLDEPFTFLDISAKIEIAKILTDNFKDKIIIIVTHNLKLFKNPKKILALKNGKIFFDEEKVENKQLERLFDIEGSDYFSTL
jgi:ABC-type Mn2+/Zn2+ transport system ATPase subunit